MNWLCNIGMITWRFPFGHLDGAFLQGIGNIVNIVQWGQHVLGIALHCTSVYRAVLVRSFLLLSLTFFEFFVAVLVEMSSKNYAKLNVRINAWLRNTQRAAGLRRHGKNCDGSADEPDFIARANKTKRCLMQYKRNKHPIPFPPTSKMLCSKPPELCQAPLKKQPWVTTRHSKQTKRGRRRQKWWWGGNPNTRWWSVHLQSLHRHQLLHSTWQAISSRPQQWLRSCYLRFRA